MASSRPTSDPQRRNKQDMANRGRLKAGTFYEGKIHACNYSAMTYIVMLNNGDSVEGVRDGTGLFCGLIGIKTTQRLSPGTRVLLAHDSTPWIIATAPADVPDLGAYLSRTITGKGLDAALKTSHPNNTKQVPEHNAAEDLYEGEFEIANLMGGFLRFLTFMTSLGANERNQIEFHLLNDMTRLLSYNFQHFACDGDRKIYDDGRLNEEENTTSYDFERMGALDKFSEKIPVADTQAPSKLDPLRTGRWRYTELRGFIGDYINQWITDPAAVLGQMAEEAVRSGKSRLHMGQDGTILWQSVSEIAFEKVVRIQVPIRLKHEEDPQGVLRKEMDSLDASFLKVWQQDSKSEHHTLFKIREYVRYLNQYQSLARIHQLAAGNHPDWFVPPEASDTPGMGTPAPQVTGGEADRAAANQGDATYWKEAYATIRILRDGSILNFDAYGNATATGPYGIQHSSSRHYHVWTAGDFMVKAGASVFISARRHVEIIAHRGGIALKGRTFLRWLCERGTLWVKSDYDPDNEYTPDDGDPKAEVIGKQGIRIQATKSETRYISWLKSRFLVQKPTAEGDDIGEIMEFGSTGSIHFSPTKEAGFSIGTRLMMRAGDVAWSCKQWLLQSQQLLLPGIAQFKAGETIIPRLKVQTLEASARIAGPFTPGQITNPDEQCCLRTHTNHITIYEGDKPELPTDRPDTTTYNMRETDPASWMLLPAAEYKWVGSTPVGEKADADLIYEPLAQQQLRLDEDAGSVEIYPSWTNASDNLLPGTQTSGTSAGWPGANARWLSHSPSGPTLSEPTKQPASSFTASTQSGLTSTAVTFRFLRK